MQKYILLDIDGVMVSAASWRPVELLPDGFYKFNSIAERNLDWLLKQTDATIILTTTHRNRYSSIEWIKIFNRRGISVRRVKVIEDINFKIFRNKLSSDDIQKLQFIIPNPVINLNERIENVLRWIAIYGNNNYVIIDDDSSLENLPIAIKKHWVKTSPMTGLIDDGAKRAIEILSNVM